MPQWSARDDLSPQEVLDFIVQVGAPSTKEIKNEFGTDSASMRRVLGKLMYHNKVFPMAWYSGVAWVPVTGKKGNVNVTKLREEAGIIGKQSLVTRAKESQPSVSAKTKTNRGRQSQRAADEAWLEETRRRTQVESYHQKVVELGLDDFDVRYDDEPWEP